MTSENSGLSRRTLAKGAAWAAPAVVVAAAAPKVSASPPLPPCVTFAFTGDACRRSNEAIYKFGFCITNSCRTGSFDLCVTRLTNQSDKALIPDGGGLPLCGTLAPTDQLCLTERVWRAASQGNGVNVYGTVNGGAEVLLFSVDAPQKTDACAPGA